MSPKLKYLLTSRKFWACLVGLLFIFIQAYKPDFPITEEQVLPIVLLLVSYILGVAIETRNRQALPPPAPEPAPEPDPDGIPF